MSKLGSLISPVIVDEFRSKYLERKHLRIETHTPERYLSLLSFHKLDEVLGTYGLFTPDIKVVSHDRPINEAEYMWKRRMVDPTKVSRLFAEGATIIFNSLQDRVEPLHDLCAELSIELGLRTQTNIYLTPPKSQGFDTHWDTHDVFVLQVEGEKQWRIYGENFPLPLENEKYKFQRGDFEPREIIDEFTLKQGEVLYIPRGMMHSATSSGEKSLHITLGVIPYTWADLLHDCIDRVSGSDERLRASVPIGLEGVDAIQAELGEKLSRAIDVDDVREVLERKRKKSIQSFRPRKTDFLSRSLTATELSEEDVIKTYPHVDISIVEPPESTRVILYTGDREIFFPFAAKKTLESVFGAGVERALGSFDDDIDWESRKLVIARLITEGLVFKQ